MCGANGCLGFCFVLFKNLCCKIALLHFAGAVCTIGALCSVAWQVLGNREGSHFVLSSRLPSSTTGYI